MNKNLKLKLKNCKGFTLMEVIVSIALFVLIIMMVSSIYTLSNKTYRAGGNENELWQNARVILDRLTREIRQAKDLVSTFPEISDNPLNPPINEFEFQDGHDMSQFTYIKYYLNNNQIKRQSIAYYFDEDPNTYVLYSDRDAFNNSPNQIILEDQIVGEYFNNIKFWGSANSINMEINLEKNNKIIELMTAVYGRNL